MRYPLAPQGVYKSIQGEGVMLGVPMTFVRLGGCSVGCAECDTDYTVVQRVTANEIADRIDELGSPEWVWITGGEPLDQNLSELTAELFRRDKRVAIATSGKRVVPRDWYHFLSVSPHGKPFELSQTSGDQINLVHGLNGLRLVDWMTFEDTGFEHCYATPVDGVGRDKALEECRSFIAGRPKWRLGVQAQKVWNIG